MYADPARIRKHFVKVSMDDAENAVIEALIKFTGDVKAPLVRDLALERAREIIASMDGANEGAFRCPNRA